MLQQAQPTVKVLLCDRAFQQPVHLSEAGCARHAIQHSTASVASLPSSEAGDRVIGVDVVKRVQSRASLSMRVLLQS